MDSLHKGTILRQKIDNELVFMNNSPHCIQAITWLREYLLNHLECCTTTYLESDGSHHMGISRLGGDIREVFPNDRLV